MPLNARSGFAVIFGNIKISSVFIARIDVLRYAIINCKPDDRQQNIEESFVLLPLIADENCA